MTAKLYQPKLLNRWTMPDSYFGAEWPECYGSGFGQSRDSDCLERCNFRVAWEAISKASSPAVEENADGDEIEMRFPKGFTVLVTAIIEDRYECTTSIGETAHLDECDIELA